MLCIPFHIFILRLNREGLFSSGERVFRTNNNGQSHISNTDVAIEIKQEFIMEWTINAALS